MAQDLDIRQFFRKAPREWLRLYFEREGLFAEFDWASLRVRNIDPLWNAWLALDADTRASVMKDFSGIKLLATPIGKVQIIDEAAYHGTQREIAEKLADLDDFYDCAFWVMLKHPECWNGAVFYASADGKSKRYWRKRINMPRLGRRPSSADGQALSNALSSFFRAREGRGEHCVVHQFRRGINGDREYYFAYPQDHRQTALEYREGEFTKRPYKPAFEIVFVHDDAQQTLNIWHEGNKERVKDLQATFAKSVLGQDIPRESPLDDRVYDLEGFLNSGCRIDPSHDLGIAGVEVRKIGIRVTFELGASDKRTKVRSFELAWPNSCSLQNDSHGILIQRMLAENGIEPRRSPAGETDGNPNH